jgi:hypothetical protein
VASIASVYVEFSRSPAKSRTASRRRCAKSTTTSGRRPSGGAATSLVNSGKPEIEVTVDTRPAERKINELEPDRDRALEPAVRPGDTPVVRRPGDHQQRAGRRGRARIGNWRSRFGHRHPRRDVQWI